MLWAAVGTAQDTSDLSADRIAALERKITALPLKREGEVTLRTVPSHLSLAPGQTFQVAIDFRIRFGWHMYGSEKGENYIPTTIKWELPEGFEVKEVQWAKPLVEADTNKPYYKRKARAIATLIAPSAVGEVDVTKITAIVRWQVCKEVCRAGKAEMEVSFGLGESKATEFAPLLAKGL